MNATGPRAEDIPVTDSLHPPLHADPAALWDHGCALFLDFDGTLVDLAPEPDAVVVPPGLVDTLAGIRARLGGALAVVSGRAVAAIDTFLHPLDLPVAGVHGSERRDGEGRMTLAPTPRLDRVEQAAAALVNAHPGLALEAKRGALALHYRQAPQLETLCREAMQAAVAASPGLVLLEGKMVFEAKSAGASKGLAIEAFLRETPFVGRRPVFFGDDSTDEAGFAAAQQAGGIGVKVGAGATQAQHRIAGPDRLRRSLADWLQAAART